jgi:hypothetical protein
MTGQFTGNVDIGQTNVNVEQPKTIEVLFGLPQSQKQILVQSQQEVKIENETPRKKVEITKENIENKVSCTKDFLRINPTVTPKSIKKMLLDIGFQLLNEEELVNIIKQASLDKYNEFYPKKSEILTNNLETTTKIFHKWTKNEESIVKTLYANDPQCSHKEFIQKFRIMLPDVKVTDRSIIERRGIIMNRYPKLKHTVKQTPELKTPELKIDINKRPQNYSNWLPNQKEFLEPLYKQVIDNSKSITFYVESITNAHNKEFPENQKTQKQIASLFYDSKSYQSKPKNYASTKQSMITARHDQQIAHNTENSIIKHTRTIASIPTTVKTIRSLIEAGFTPENMQTIKPIIRDLLSHQGSNEEIQVAIALYKE